MLKTQSGEKILFCLLEEDAQYMAKERFNIILDESELESVKKGLSWGLDCWDIVLKTAIEEVVLKREE